MRWYVPSASAYWPTSSWASPRTPSAWLSVGSSAIAFAASAAASANA